MNAAPAPAHYVLRLYTTGLTARSARAIERVQRICRTYLAGRYDLEIVDLYAHPGLAREAQVVAAPTLVKASPQPLRRIVGDMADEARVLAGLGVVPPALPAPDTRNGPLTR